MNGVSGKVGSSFEATGKGSPSGEEERPQQVHRGRALPGCNITYSGISVGVLSLRHLAFHIQESSTLYKIKTLLAMRLLSFISQMPTPSSCPASHISQARASAPRGEGVSSRVGRFKSLGFWYWCHGDRWDVWWCGWMWRSWLTLPCEMWARDSTSFWKQQAGLAPGVLWLPGTAIWHVGREAKHFTTQLCSDVCTEDFVTQLFPGFSSAKNSPVTNYDTK